MSKKLDIFKTGLQVEIYSALKELGFTEESSSEAVGIDITHPKIIAMGDYTTTIALKLGKILKKAPLETAHKINEKFKVQSKKLKKLGVERVEVRPPGFINFWVSTDFLISQLGGLLENEKNIMENSISLEKLAVFLSRYSKEIKQYPNSAKKPKIMVEFAHPNTHKEFHIGHLRNITLAESLVRLLESLKVEVIRANYQGDVGMHIAKCLYGILHNFQFSIFNFQKKTIYERVKFLGEAYAVGSKAFEENPKAKEEIIEINQKIYEKDPKIESLLKETRQWSLDYFEEIYKRVGSHFDRKYFESEVYESGKKLVLEYLEKKVFEKSQGAIIFPGEKYGLHNRVFINSQGFPTYEAKDMGLGKLQFDEYNPDFIIHVVGPEQAGYFEVVFKALSMLFPETQGREIHFQYGWVQLKKGKMSSRLGNVVTAKWLIDEAKNKAIKLMKISGEKYSPNEVEEIAEKVAVAAVKYSMLKFSPRSDILFDFDEAVTLEGDSGPYIMYTYSRCQSVLRKIKNQKSKIKMTDQKLKIEYNEEEKALLRIIYRFPEVVYEAGTNMAPNLLCNFLYDLSQKYNLFYTKHSILTPKESGEEVRNFRIKLTQSISQILKKGLDLLGIEVTERM